ncbi:MAG: glucosaminidase domain-containing protein [Puniceicoccales bacterium]|nr:glucosaminidase domain-containing protein [Puniceicoccales bacterium]
MARRFAVLVLALLLLPLTAMATDILGQDDVPPQAMEAYLLSRNPALNRRYVHHLVAIYRQECRREGVRPLVAFAQMCWETNHLRFTGTVNRRQNNFCGLGVTGNGVRGDKFAFVRQGVRAHVQHLKTYASPLPLHARSVDRRRRFVLPGSAPTIEELTGRWGMDKNYGHNIVRLMDAITGRR